MTERTEEERKAYNRQKMQDSRNRKRAKLHEEMSVLAEQAAKPDAPKLARLARLILEAQRLAEEINAETIQELKGLPQTPTVARLLESYENREIRITLAKVDLPE